MAIVVVVTVTTTIDLTPFGFTNTESRVYNALLGLGPSSGYAIAQAVGIARANAYDAISALQAKGALTVLAERPLRVRAVRADALVALVAARHSERLEVLDQQIKRQGGDGGGDGMVPIATERALVDLATRIIVREEGPLIAVAPGSFYAITGPAWRKRLADGRDTSAWRYGEVGNASPIATELDVDEVLKQFGGPAVLLAGTSTALWAASGPDTRGWWVQDHLTVGLVSAAIAKATTT